MKVTYNWLKDFVDIKIKPQALADKLTMAGLEVTSLEEKHGDFVFEIEVTSNRPDWLSVIGIAREVAAITNAKLKTKNSKLRNKTLRPKTHDLRPLDIIIENKKDCPLYTAKIIQDVKVGPSPEWMKKRLELIGCRSVNNIVDITNYILFEYGEPLHAFDLDKLNYKSQITNHKIIVRRAKEKEEITTIDGIKRMLDGEILVIASGEKPVAIAGVMGGKDTEVTVGTKNILLEAAIFDPIIIRKARQKLGTQSDSSYRFERGVDIEAVAKASGRAAELIEQLASGKCVQVKSATAPRLTKKTILLNTSLASKILGIDITVGQAKKILNNLGLITNPKIKNNLSVTIPSHRQDLNLEIDLVEEIARIFGYDLIPQSMPAAKPSVTLYEPRDLVSGVKNILIGLGLNEVITYSLVDRDLAREDTVEVMNPLSQEQAVLRTSLIPSLAKCIAYNLNQKKEYINIFEIAKSYTSQACGLKEELILGVALCGARPFLLEQGLVRDEASLLHLKGIAEILFNRLSIKHYDFSCATDSGRIEVKIKEEKIGVMIRLPKGTLERLDIKNREVFALEVSLEKILQQAQLDQKYVSLPKYPGITRDISLVIKEDILIKQILQAIQEAAKPLLQEAKVVDYYKGKQIPAGFRGLTLSCVYLSSDRTLTEAEITPLHSQISAILTEQFNAKIR